MPGDEARNVRVSSVGGTLAGTLAMLIAGLVGWGASALLGDDVSFMTSFTVSTIVSGVAYIAAFVWLKSLRP